MRRTIALLGACIAAAAHADCVDGMRDTTPAEIQYQKRVVAAMKDALPAPPAGWTVGAMREAGADGLCRSTREGDFEIRLATTFTYKPSREEGDRLRAEHRKLQSEIDALKQLPPAVAKERQAWLDKMSAANRASNAAAKAGDKALARQKDAEAEDFSRKGHEVRNAYLASVRAQVEQLEARQKALQYGGTSIDVRLVANERYPAKIDAASASEVVAGKLPTPMPAGMKVHNVRAVLEGTAAKREQILAALDRNKLARIVQ